ncbi:MAG: ribosomal protein S19 family protein [Candidatus Micrarchaeota archaeon]|nr:ribosomal protein S19 family protein [Candidatus Micrarchaeota archaeon]
MAKITVYGMDVDKFAAISADEFVSKYANARARRAYKHISDNPAYKKLMARIKKMRESKSSKVIKTHVREAVILPEWIGMKIGVHNGKEFVAVEILPTMVGRRLGDFSHTTKRVAHSGPGVGATRGSKFVPLK